MLLPKDKSPLETVEQIKHILSEIGIFVKEVKRFSFSDHTHSVGLCAEELDYIRSNGKGFSESTALASGYAEIMERLQNRGTTISQSRYGIMPTNDFKYFPDEKTMDSSSMLDENTDIFNSLLNFSIEDIPALYNEDFVAVPMLNVFDSKVEYLPYEFLMRNVANNGMCAGNTAEEALVQGICEIFERFSIREVFDKKLFLPGIALDDVKHLETFKMISEIRKRGYEILIKDASLGGRLPVLGVILIDKNTGRYHSSFGSHPVFEVALQRCITEMFQGVEKLDPVLIPIDYTISDADKKHFPSMEDYEKAQYIKYILKKGPFSSTNIFFSKQQSNYMDAFQISFRDNKDSLKFILQQIRKNNHKVYVRDVSFLGFPTYYAYIPGMSELWKLTKDEVSFLSQKDSVLKCLFRIKASNIDEIDSCAQTMEKLYHMPASFCFNLVSRHFTDYFTSKCYSKGSGLNFLLNDLELLLALFFLKAGNYKKAYKYLNIFLKERPSSFSSNRPSFLCLLTFLKLKSDGYSDNLIAENLASIHGEDLCEEIMNTCEESNSVLGIFNLPECGSCDRCPVVNECKYETWKKVNSNIVNKIKTNPIDQEDLKKLFSEILQ